MIPHTLHRNHHGLIARMGIGSVGTALWNWRLRCPSGGFDGSCLIYWREEIDTREEDFSELGRDLPRSMWNVDI